MTRFPQVVEVANGDLIMYCRTSLGWVFHTRSLDKGRTWTNFEPITLPNPDSKIHALGLPVSALTQSGTLRGDL